MKTPTLPAIFLLAALSFLTGCSSLFFWRSTPDAAPQSSSPQGTRSLDAAAAKLEIPEQELAWIAAEAAKRQGGTVVDIDYQNRSNKNILVVFLATNADNRSGKTAIFKRTATGWQEEVGAAGVWSE